MRVRAHDEATMLRARLCDPQGPGWTRAMPALAALAAIALGLLLPGEARVRATVALAGIALLFGRRLLSLRHVPRQVELRLGPARVDIVGAGPLQQRVRAWDLTGASTARTDRGVALALVRRRAPERPLVLEFDAEADLEAVRRSLGIGHRGFGDVSWPTTRIGNTRAVALTILAFPWLALAMSAAAGDAWLALMVVLPLVPATSVILVSAAVFGTSPGPRVALTQEAVLVIGRWGTATRIRYADVTGATARPHGIAVETRTRTLAVPMGGSLAEERDHLVAQSRSAAQRARGEGPPPPRLPAPVAMLAPDSENGRTWLERVDAAAASLLASDSAYRQSGLRDEDLWSALESPDAPTPVRAAAARVLARVAPDEAKTRIADALAANRDQYADAFIRIALEDDVDAAARDLQRLTRG